MVSSTLVHCHVLANACYRLLVVVKVVFSGLVVGVCYRRYHCGMKKSYKNSLSLFEDMQVLQTEKI